jgi:hypothetical protein
MGSRPVGRSIKPAILAAIAGLAAAACAGKSIGPAYLAQAPYQGWSCDQLSREAARTDDGLGAGEKKAIEQVMIEKSCIHPLAAETE